MPEIITQTHTFSQLCLIKYLKRLIKVESTYRLNSYYAINTFRPGYKIQSVNRARSTNCPCILVDGRVGGILAPFFLTPAPNLCQWSATGLCRPCGISTPDLPDQSIKTTRLRNPGPHSLRTPRKKPLFILKTVQNTHIHSVYRT